MNIGTIMAYIFGLFLLYLIGMLLVIPIKVIIKLIVNGVIGGILLVIFNFIGGLIGLNLIINPLSAIIAGLLGVPGIILLLIVQNVL